MKTLKLAHKSASNSSLEMPSFAVVIIAVAALMFLWLILHDGFSVQIEWRDSKLSILTHKKPDNLPGANANSPPIANAGPDKAATVGTAISFSGSGSALRAVNCNRPIALPTEHAENRAS